MDNPFVLSFLKFALLGTAGEIIAKLIRKVKIDIKLVFWSMIVWGILGVLIKFIFTGFHGFVGELQFQSYIPSGELSKAIFTSIFTNALFGPWVIILHRLLDNLIFGKIRIPTEGIKGALLTLLWFWVPAHSVTFYLPKEQQITLAAIWSFVLGLMLALFNNKKFKE